MPETAKLCECGCGEPTLLASQTSKRFGWAKGEPLRFLLGHRHRNPGPDYVEEDRGHETPCWIWQKASHPLGYGAKAINGQPVPAHRFYYEQEHGPVPDGLELDHLCRVHGCVNPDHLEAVTHAENMRRGNPTRLTGEQAREIKGLLAEGTPRRELANRFGVHKDTIRNIDKGRTWQ